MTLSRATTSLAIGWRDTAFTSVDGRRRPSTDVDALGVNGP